MKLVWLILGQSTSENLLPGSLSFAIRSLADAEFASKTVTPKPKDEDNVSCGSKELVSY